MNEIDQCTIKRSQVTFILPSRSRFKFFYKSLHGSWASILVKSSNLICTKLEQTTFNIRSRLALTPLRVNLIAKLKKCECWNKLVTSNRIPSAYEEQADSYTPTKLQSTWKKSRGEVSADWNRLPTFLRLPIHSPPGQSWSHHRFESFGSSPNRLPNLPDFVLYNDSMIFGLIIIIE